MLYLGIARYLFPDILDHHSYQSLFIQIAVLALLRLFEQRVEAILDHVLVLGVVEEA